MKKLIGFMLILTVIILTSCDNTPAKIDSPEKGTTVELQQKASLDTNCYKVIVDDNKLYVINSDNLLVAKAENTDGDVLTMLIFAAAGILLMTVIGIAKN